VNKFKTGTVALALMLGAAACSSSSKPAATTSTTTAATATTTAAAGTTAGTTGAAGTTAATAGGAAATTVPAVAGLDPVQSQALAIAVAQAKGLGYTVDEACLGKVMAKMSDGDAQIIVTGGVETNPSLSPAGEALNPQAVACVTPPATTA